MDTEREAPEQERSTAAAMLGLSGFVVLAVSEVDGELEQAIETTADLVGCTECGAVAELHDRRPTWVWDLSSGGHPVMLVWVKRVWCSRYMACSKRTWTKNQQIRVEPVGQPCGSKGSPKCASLRYVPDNSNLTKSFTSTLINDLTLTQLSTCGDRAVPAATSITNVEQ